MNGFVLLSESTLVYVLYHILDRSFCEGTPSAGLQRDLNNRLRYAKFVENFYSALDVQKLDGVAVETGRHCLMRCLKNDKCFSTNIGAFYLPNGNISCELLPTDKYNASKKFKANHTFHHYSIMSSCESFPCLHGSTCQALYETNDYRCSCPEGYTGKNCENDIDECISGDHKCLSGTATCTNTVGSFTCSCNNGYLGDGITSCVPAECQNYRRLTNGDRKNTYTGIVTCDYHTLLPGWYRFQGAAGTKMASACVPKNYCGTHAPGWLNGVHPTVAEGQVIRQVCFNYYSNCCQWSINVYMRNCGDYFVYHINRTPPEHTCHLRYCGAD